MSYSKISKKVENLLFNYDEYSDLYENIKSCDISQLIDIYFDNLNNINSFYNEFSTPIHCYLNSDIPNDKIMFDGNNGYIRGILNEILKPIGWCLENSTNVNITKLSKNQSDEVNGYDYMVSFYIKQYKPSKLLTFINKFFKIKK